MHTAVLISIGLAGAVGLLVGFHKRWAEACLLACVGVPATVSVIFAMRLDAPTLFDAGGWALITFLYALICACIAWGVCAGANHGVCKLYRKLTHRSSDDRPQAAGPLS